MELYDRFSRSEGFELVHATMHDYLSAVEMSREHDSPSFVDATVVSYMR